MASTVPPASRSVKPAGLPGRLGRPRRADDEAIFRAVLRTLARVGFANLTFAAIADEVHISASALHQRFGSKNRLLRAFVEWNNARLHARFAARGRKARGSVEDLYALLTDWLASDSAHDTGSRVFALYSEVAAEPGLREPVAARFEFMVHEIETLLESAVESGDLQQCDAPRLARAVLAAAGGTVLLYWLTRPAETLVDQLRTTVDAILAPYAG